MNLFDIPRRNLYTLYDKYGSQDVVVCDHHAEQMPTVDGDTCRVAPADADLTCEFCTESEAP